MNREDLQKTVNDAVNDAELKSEEIPAIDLYVDQILNLVSECLKNGSERYFDRQLTKTMINNYSKEGLITPVKGKKYDKEQILQILMIYTLKNTISIGEIKRLIDAMYATEDFDVNSLTRMYDRHLEIKDAYREQVTEVVDGIIARNDLDVTDELDYISLIFALTAFSAHLKNVAQAMIDARYPINTEADEDKVENKYDRKREKITAKGEAKIAKKVAKVEAKVEAKVAKVEAKGILPSIANPAAVVIKSCSAIPKLKNLSGNSFANIQV